MSKRYRGCLKKATTNKEYNCLLIKINYPMYWDEGYAMHPKYRKGYKNPNKYIFLSKVREYKTWKYNRKTQFK